MREFALLLLLANLGFAAWGYWIAPRDVPRGADWAAARNVS